MSMYNKTKPTAPEEMLLGAGVLLAAFDPATGDVTDADILGATTGGIHFTATPQFKDFGDGLDNAPLNTLQFKEIDSVEARLSGTFLSVTDEIAAKLAAAADISSVASTTHTVSKITPRGELTDADFDDLWFVGKYGKGGDNFIAIHMLNTLNTGGFSIQSVDKDKGSFAFDFLAHYDIEDPDTVPYEIFIGTVKTTP